ncbi:MAG TPA: aldo/keto reductase [Ignavibacteriaceae bacterium]|jgi:aryl-alcohol dehydrogenase-like predicted oxidoreductase|nr:aldo/keto reductase [Ignavibacteriaceae bacterium]
MEYRNLGRTGVKVSSICLGCMMFGRRADENLSSQLVDKAIDSGINFIDTANVYQRGVSETYTGKALKKNGKRKQIVLATKVHGKMNDEDPNAMGNSRRHIIEQCEASLKRLQTDHIDLYQVHRPQADIPIDETLRALDDLISSGKVRYIGTSTFGAWQVVESLWVSKELGLNRFISEQPPYHLLDRRIERELLPAAQNYGMAILPWSPLAGGFLTGKYKRNEERPENTRFKNDQFWSTRQFNDKAFDVVETVQKIAEEKGCTPAQLSLAWVIQKPAVTSAIIGPRNLEQLDDNIKAVEVTLDEEDNRRLDEVSKPGDYVLSFYDADFGPYKYNWH